MVQSFNCATINITIQQRAPNNQSLTQDFPNNLSTTQPTNHGTQTANSTSLEIIHCLMQIFAAFAGNQALIQQWHRLANHKGFFFLGVFVNTHSDSFSCAVTHVHSPITHLPVFSFIHFLYFLICWPTNHLSNSANQSSTFVVHSLFPVLPFSWLTFLLTDSLPHSTTDALSQLLPYPLSYLLFYAPSHLFTHLLTLSLCHLLTHLVNFSFTPLSVTYLLTYSFYILGDRNESKTFNHQPIVQTLECSKAQSINHGSMFQASNNCWLVQTLDGWIIGLFSQPVIQSFSDSIIQSFNRSHDPDNQSLNWAFNHSIRDRTKQSRSEYVH